MLDEKREDLIGREFNNLRVTGPAVNRGGRPHWPCVCTVMREGRECGRPRHVTANGLKIGKAKMCQACAREALKQHRRELGRRYLAGAGAR